MMWIGELGLFQLFGDRFNGSGSE